jgi:hypothetical protein
VKQQFARRHVAPLGHIIIEMGLRASSAWRGVRRLCRMYKFKTNLSFGWDVNKTEVPCWEIATLWSNMFLLLLLNAACLVEKQQIPIYILRCDPTDARTHDLHIVLEMKICNYWSELNSWNYFLYNKEKLKNLLVRTKLYWSWTGGPVLTVRTVRSTVFETNTLLQHRCPSINIEKKRLTLIERVK